jgi:crotonobetainyl-CoA:carnitine CoA-transferase CaiB-like acyl-CoA transferase
VWVALSVPGDDAVDHDVFDEMVVAWTGTQNPAAIVETLRAQNIPAELLVSADQMYDIPQLDARGFYEEFERPVTGVHRYPGWPFRITPGPARHHRTVAPTLGQHNDEILRGLGFSVDEVAALGEQRVIGEHVPNT